jgi:hypothetical protein
MVTRNGPGPSTFLVVNHDRARFPAGVQLDIPGYDRRCQEVPDARLMDAMKNAYALLLSLLGLIGIIFNRFAVEETLRIMPTWVWPSLPVWFGRIIVILSGTFLVFFGLLSFMGYLQ